MDIFPTEYYQASALLKSKVRNNYNNFRSNDSTYSTWSNYYKIPAKEHLQLLKLPVYTQKNEKAEKHANVQNVNKLFPAKSDNNM